MEPALCESQPRALTQNNMHSRDRVFSRLAALAMLAGAISVAAQNPAPRATPHAAANVLPQLCLISDGATAEVVVALRTLEEHPTANAYNVIGTLYYEADRLSCAVPALEASLQLQNHNWRAHYYLAQALLRTGDDTRADREMETARAQGGAEMLALLKVDIDNQGAISRFVEVANQNLASGNASVAAQNYQKALQLSPRDPKLHYNLSVALEKLGNSAAEKKELETAVALDPNIAVAQNRLGWLALQDGERQEAELRFKKALAIKAEFAEAQNGLGVLYSREGKTAEASSLFESAVKNDPSYAPAYVNYGLLLQSQGSLDKAEAQFLAALQIDSRNADALAALGMLQRQNGRLAEAVETLQRAVALEPDSAQYHLDLGLALQDEPDRPDAFNEFSEAAHLAPDLAAAHYNLGHFFFEAAKYDEAERELQAALHINPDDVGALFYLGATAAQEGQLTRSTELLKKAVALQPHNADAQYLLGRNLEHSGDSAGAIQHWKAAIEARPDFSQALYSLAKALRNAHDPEAQKYQDDFDVVLKNQQIADRVTELGNVALQSADAHKWPEALEQMNQAIELCGNCAQSAHLHKNLGLFYARMGKSSEAMQELRTALTLAPNDIDAKNALTKLEQSTDVPVK